MSHAIQVHEPGGPEVLRWESVETPSPGKGELLIRHTAVGVNFIDTYHRTGLYPPPNGYPFIPGAEGAGMVEAVGEGGSQFKPGDRVAYTGGALGSYAEFRTIDAQIAIKLPDFISEQQAVAVLAKGLTAHYLLTKTYPVKKGDTILIHAAAGGVGLLMCQWANHLGAQVIGTVSTKEKAELAQAHGCHHTIIYTQERFADRLMQLTQRRKCDVVYDSVGKDTFLQSLDCVKPLGMMVSFGQSSGKVDPIDIGLLSQKGSIYLTRPTLFHYIADPEVYQKSTAELFDMIKKGVLKITTSNTFALQDAASAHRALESRATTGAIVLQP